VPRSRRPHHSPTATPAEVVAGAVERRRQLVGEGLDQGARSVRWSLEQDGWACPSERTIHGILVVHGLVEPQPRKRPRSSYKRFASPWANGCRQMDGHDRTLVDGTMAVVLRVQDDCSRQIMASRAARSENSADAWRCVQAANRRHAAPAMGTPPSRLSHRGKRPHTSTTASGAADNFHAPQPQRTTRANRHAEGHGERPPYPRAGRNHDVRSLRPKAGRNGGRRPT
jgi:hypothetical protein